MDVFDQLHVVSDLHLGGIVPHQVFNQAEALSSYIEYLAAQASTSRVGLVLNGDTVDFLAMPQACYLDPIGAPAKLGATIADNSFGPVWSAIGTLVAMPRATVVFVLGNHDVELAMPACQAILFERICHGDAACRGRLRMCLDGTGYRCCVGGRSVLCVHGNDTDPWNVVDHAELLRVIAARNASLTPPAWEPNAGTRLVVDVLNDVKTHYPFVDLLKPETVLVPAVLLALPRNYRASLTAFARIAIRRLYDQGRLATGFLAAEAWDTLGPEQALDAILRAHPAAGAVARRSATARATLEQAMQDHAEGLRPEALDPGSATDTLGRGGLLWDRITGQDPQENLRAALLDYLAADRTFDVGAEDQTFRQLDQDTGEMDYIVAGHTHLERCLDRRAGCGTYYNTGTWMRLLRLTPELLQSAQNFAPVFDALQAGTLARLDQTDGLVLPRRTVVTLGATARGVESELRHVREARGAGALWQTASGSQRVQARRD